MIWIVGLVMFGWSAKYDKLRLISSLLLAWGGDAYDKYSFVNVHIPQTKMENYFFHRAKYCKT